MRATAFDNLAERYDSEFTASALGYALRAMVTRRLEQGFAGRERLLEIGCGTGEDAVNLARRGHRVLATDASADMVRIATRKAELRGCADRLEFRCLPMECLGAELGAEKFAGVYSNFGAVNCVRDVASLGADVARLLEPGAPLIWVVMGRYAPWEWFWYLARGAPRKAFRRLRSEGVEWRGLTVRYPSPAMLARALRPHFTAIAVSPLGCALPPSYAAAWLARHPRTFAGLENLERAMQRWPALAAFADHYVFEANRKADV